MSPLDDVVDRLWAAAYGLDQLRGDTAASEWTARKVRGLMRAGTAGDVAEVTKLADVVDRRLERERATRREVGSCG